MLFPHSMLNKSNKFVGSTWFSKGAVKVTPTKQKFIQEIKIGFSGCSVLYHGNNPTSEFQDKRVPS